MCDVLNIALEKKKKKEKERKQQQEEQEKKRKLQQSSQGTTHASSSLSLPPSLSASPFFENTIPCVYNDTMWCDVLMCARLESHAQQLKEKLGTVATKPPLLILQEEKTSLQHNLATTRQRLQAVQLQNVRKVNHN